jgi:hypothetical protein
MVNPRRVVVSRSTKKAGNQPLKFHKAERLHVSAIAAGMVHSTAITEDGLIFYWMSGDPNLHTHQVCTFHFTLYLVLDGVNLVIPLLR